MIDRLRTRYAIGYVSSNTNKDGKFRKIKVKLSPEVEKHEGKLDIVTRRGYYGQKAAETKKTVDNPPQE
jgi:hypothetical protein